MAGAQSAGDLAREVVAKLAHRNGEAVHHDAADGEEPDDNVHDVFQSLGIWPNLAVIGDSVEKIEADVEVEDS